MIWTMRMMFDEPARDKIFTRLFSLNCPRPILRTDDMVYTTHSCLLATAAFEVRCRQFEHLSRPHTATEPRALCPL
jgi:hypothetical protein